MLAKNTLQYPFDQDVEILMNAMFQIVLMVFSKYRFVYCIKNDRKTR